MKAQYKRRDGRQALELRAKELRVSELTHFDGSSWYSQGLSSALVAIHGPTTAKPLEQDYERCRVRVRVLHAAATPPSGGTERVNQLERVRIQAHQLDAQELVGMVERCLEAIFIAERFPYTVLCVDVVVMGNDGSLPAVVLNAVMCAMLSAGLPCRTTMAAVSVAVLCSCPLNPSSDASLEPALELVLDPTTEEQTLRPSPNTTTVGEGEMHSAEGDASPSWGCLGHGTFVFANPKCEAGLLASHVKRGPGAALSPLPIAAMAQLAERGVNLLFEFFRNCNVPLEE